MDSIFDALDSPRDHYNANNNNSNKQGPTMRML